MPIKDLVKRREYQRKLMAKKRLTKNNVSPQNNKLDPVRPCSRCSDLEQSITNFYNLTIEAQQQNKELVKQIHQLEKKLTIANSMLKDEVKINSLNNQKIKHFEKIIKVPSQ